MKEILPIESKIPFSCDKEVSHVFSVLCVHKESINFKKWFIRNFSDLWFIEHNENATMGFDKPKDNKINCFRPEGYKHDYFDKPYPDVYLTDCELFVRKQWDRDTLEKKYETIIDLIKERIQLGWYMYFEIDNFYVPCAVYHHQLHYNSGVLIYGFDDETEEIYVADYYGPFDRNVSYKHCKIKYGDFIKAYSSYECSKNLSFEPLLTFKYKDTNIEVIEGELKYALKRYLNGMNDQYNKISFGIKCYDSVIKELDNRYIELQLINYLYGHSKALELKYNYLRELDLFNDEIKESELFNELNKYALIVKNTILKYVVSQDKDIKDKVLNLILQLKEKDSQCIEFLIDNFSTAENVYRWNRGLKKIE